MKNAIPAKNVTVMIRKQPLLLLLACALALSSCHKEKEIPAEGSSYLSVNADGSTTYSLVNEVIPVAGLGISCTVFEYDAADVRVDSNYIESPEYRHEYKFTPCSQCHHLKVKVCSTEKTRWGPTVYTLRKGCNTKIAVTLSTEYGFQEPACDADKGGHRPPLSGNMPSSSILQ